MDRLGYIERIPAEIEEPKTNSGRLQNPVTTEDASTAQESVRAGELEEPNNQVDAVESNADVVQSVAPPLTSHADNQHEVAAAFTKAPGFARNAERVEVLFKDDVMKTLGLSTAEEYCEHFWKVQTEVMTAIVWSAAAWSVRSQQCWELYHTLHPRFDHSPGDEEVVFQGTSYRLTELQNLLRANQDYAHPGPWVFLEVAGPHIDDDTVTELRQLDNQLVDLYAGGAVDLDECVVIFARHVMRCYRLDYRRAEQWAQNSILRQRLLARMSQEKKEHRERQRKARQQGLSEEHC